MRSIGIVLTLILCQEAVAATGPLYVGWARVDITPDRPVALIGQLHKRISQKVRDPLTATALALETRGQDGQREQAILVSCDVLFIRKAVQDRLKEIVRTKLADFESEKLFLNATHTHTAPGFGDQDFEDLYDVSKDEGVMKASQYADFFVERLTRVVVDAWQSRKPGGMSWALGHAVVGQNRRAHYFDGSSIMYGKTNRADFANLEGYEDHAVEMLFFWDQDKTLTGVVVNIACTAQETEGLSEVSADFWHDVRLEMRRRFSKDLFLLPQCAAAGDSSPHFLFRARRGRDHAATARPVQPPGDRPADRRCGGRRRAARQAGYSDQHDLQTCRDQGEPAGARTCHGALLPDRPDCPDRVPRAPSG